MIKHLLLLNIIFYLYVFAHDDDNSFSYDVNNFHDSLQSSNNLIMFYAPWCGHCQRLAPVWSQLVDKYRNSEDHDIKIGKVDCTKEVTLCEQNDIIGYPTIKFFGKGGSDQIKFKGTRDLSTLSGFLEEQLQNKIKVDQQTPSNLNKDDFAKHISNGKHLIMFFSHSSDIQESLDKVWENLSESLRDSKAVLQLSTVDCEANSEICTMFDVTEFPKILFIENGKKIEEFQKEYTLEELKKYAKNIVNVDSKLDEGKVREITADIFEDTIKKGTSFIKFYAPWCGHCKRLSPIWEDLGKKFSDRKEVSILKMDCTTDTNKNICIQEEVNGYPSMFIYKFGKKISEYTGNRNIDDMYDFVSKHLLHDEL